MDLDQPFDVLAASVDGLAVLIDFKRLQTANDIIRQAWVDFYSAPIDADGMNSAQATDARKIIYEKRQRAPQNALLIHVAVEIKTVIASAAIESAIASLQSLQSDENARKLF